MQHQPGRKVTAADNAPEFSAQTLPAGTAPADRTFSPNPVSEVAGQALNPDASDNSEDAAATSTSAADTLGGATSADVHTGYGHPGQGMTSNELRHDGKHTASKDGSGLVGTGAGHTSELKTANPRSDERQRALDKDDAVPGRPNTDMLGAEEMIPVSAEEVAAERD